MARLKLTLAYEGTRFAGWQMQAFRKQTQPLTVQGELERIFSVIMGRRVPVFGAGRTDSGVHAEAQVCHIDLPESALRINWLRALNVQLPPDIRILAVNRVPDDFHARISAIRKEYAYSLWMHDTRAAPRVQAFVWSVPNLDISAMHAAAVHLIGRHDFASFRNTGTPQPDTVRTIFSITPIAEAIGPLTCPKHWPVATWHILGDGFLKQMIRNIMGMLVWAGLGKLDPNSVPRILAAQDRRALPSPSAPAQGLTLMRIEY